MTIDALSNSLSVENNLELLDEENASGSLAPCEVPWHADVLGVKVSAINLQLAVSLAEQRIARRQPGYFCVTGVHGVMEAQRNPALLRILNSAALNLPDGMPMTWVGRIQGFHQMDRVYGPDFMSAMCKLSVERGYRNFLCGGKPGIAQELGEKLQERFPGLNIVGVFTPPFRPMSTREYRKFLAQIARSKPHIIWVGLSTPKQERFMAELAKNAEGCLMVGVGAAFDYHTGRIRECSHWIKRAGLQWLHRLIQDPKHLWKRYLTNNPAFLWRIFLQLTRLRKYPS